MARRAFNRFLRICMLCFFLHKIEIVLISRSSKDRNHIDKVPA